MATLVHIGPDSLAHIISYPSDPTLAEAALELLSENRNEIAMLTELANSMRIIGVVDAGNQGELAARLLMISAWRRLVCRKRKSNNKVRINI